MVRDEEGTFRVLEDNLRNPSGVSYVMENRRTMARVFPDLFTQHRVRPVGDYTSHLLRALRAAAAANVADPMVVVLTPGVHNSAYFEHSLLARLMGVELVEGRDMFCRDNVVYLRTTEGEQQVDVIYRRIDDEFLDPVHYRPDSVLGVAGILNAARAGNVVVANAVGNGVGDDKLVYTYVPEMVKYYLNEKPLLPNVDTFRCWLPDEFDYVMQHMEELVVKPVEGSGGYGIVFGPEATPAELAALNRKVWAYKRGWIAQPVVQLFTVPSKVDERLAPRHVDLRPFAVLRARDAGDAARDRRPRAIRLRVPPHETGGEARRDRRGRKPRLGRRLDRRLVGLRPDERDPGRHPARLGRVRAGLRRRRTAQGHLHRRRSVHFGRIGAADPADVN